MMAALFRLALLCGAWSAAASATTYPMTTDHWDVQGTTGFEERDARQALRLGSQSGKPIGGGQANLKDIKFESGVIEFDLMITGDYDFVGPVFRQVADGFGEVVYLRPHLIGKPDSIQYTPIVNGNLAWQIFTGAGFEAQAAYPLNKWIHVRTDVYQSSATVAIDGKRVLHIPYLKGRSGSGDIGVLALAGGDYIANFSVEPIVGYRDPEPSPSIAPLPRQSVTSWQVSPAMAQAEAFSRAARTNWAEMKWTPVAVETNGIANLSKAGPDDKEHYSFIARFAVDSPSAHREPMQFGFSDDVRVYVNGVPLYEGSDRQNSRDYRFLGHVGFWDSVFLPLRKGRNDIVLVVSDQTNGGTAAAARFDPGSTVRIEGD